MVKTQSYKSSPTKGEQPVTEKATSHNMWISVIASLVLGTVLIFVVLICFVWFVLFLFKIIKFTQLTHSISLKCVFFCFALFFFLFVCHLFLSSSFIMVCCLCIM